MTSPIYVAKPSDLAVLTEKWNLAKEGNAQTVLLTGEFGGGKRAIVAELARRARADEQDVLVFRPVFSEEEDGQNALVKLFASIYSYLHGNLALRGKVEMALSSRLPNQPQRVQRWIRSFIDGMKKGAPKPGETQFQLHLPTDNPLIGFIEIIHEMAQAFPVILEFQNIHALQSIPMVAMLKAYIHEAQKVEGIKLLTIMSSLPIEGNEAWLSLPLQDTLKEEAENFSTLSLEAWGADDVTAYLASKEYGFGHEEKIAELTKGRPGFIAELADSLNEDEELLAKLPDLTLETFVDLSPDEDELEEASEEGEQGRKPAKADDAERIAFISALLGLSFPSGIVADMLALERGSVDDIFDATEDVYKEVQHSKPLGTWIYQFQKAMYRESVLARHQSEDDLRITGNTAAFVERFLAPAGYGYAVKALRLYAKAGLEQHAARMRNVALGADQPQMWNLSRDIYQYFDEVSWSDAIKRTTYINLCERMSRVGDVNEAEKLLKETLDWAAKKEDKALRAFLRLSGSRLDARRQDLYRARERAQEALELYRELDSKVQQAEALGQLALIEFNDGKPNAAIDRVNQADELSEVPALRALTNFIRGLVAQRDKNLEKATEYFEHANQLAGQAGRGALALDAGMKMGEVLLTAGHTAKAADVLNRVAQIAQGIRAPAQERTACAMLAQAHASLQNFEAALGVAQRALQISTTLKFQKLIPADLYNVGLFQLMLKKPSEAVAILKQARQLADATNVPFMKELLFHLAQAQLQIGERSVAEQTLAAVMKPIQATQDGGRALIVYQQMGELAIARNDISRAKQMYNQALNVAKQVKNKEAQKALKERLKDLNKIS